MNTDIEKLEWALFGAYLLDCGGIRDRVKSSDIGDETIAACVQEMELHAKGEVNKADIRRVPSLMESLGCRTDIKAIQAIEDRVKEHRKESQISKALIGAMHNKGAERLKYIDRIIQLRGDAE